MGLFTSTASEHSTMHSIGDKEHPVIARVKNNLLEFIQVP
jgi:hypothetical protein